MKQAMLFSVFTFSVGVLVTRYHYGQQQLSNKGLQDRGKRIVSKKHQPMCTDHEQQEHGPVDVISDIPSWDDLEKRFSTLKLGGSFVPLDCQAIQTIAVIIPYRNRDDHLRLFLQHMHPFLQHQNLEYTIYVVELEQHGLFKKTLLMNAGFLEVSKMSKHSPCFVFHDVDMLPEHTAISYACAETDVKHPTVFIKQFNYKRFNSRYMGGCLIFPKKRYEEVNGFSNLYWGWGGEDVDMHKRLLSTKIRIIEPTNTSLRYMSWDHKRQPLVKNKEEFVRTAVERMHVDGLNSARYHVLRHEKRPLYTWILISSNMTDASYKNIKPIHVKNPYWVNPLQNDIL